MGNAGMKRINLIPPEYAVGRKAFMETSLHHLVFYAGVALLIGVSVHYGLTMSQLAPLETAVKRLNEKAADTQVFSEAAKRSKASLQAQFENLEHRMSVIGKKRGGLVQLKGSEFKWSETLTGFKNSIPERVWVDHLLLSPEGSSIAGGAYTNDQVGNFIEKLNNSGFFRNAAFAKTEAGELGGREIVFFELTFDLTRG
jgi:Tfp pilus assembly protein PilN